MLSQEPDHTTHFGRMSLRARRVPAAIRALFMLAALGATALSILADVGPFKVITDAQAAVFVDGGYSFTLSLLLTFLACVMPAAIAIHLLAGLFPDNTPPNPYGAGPFADRPFPQGPNPYGQGPYWQGPHLQGHPAQPPHAQPPHAQPPHAQPPQGQVYTPPGQVYTPPGQPPRA